MTTFWILVWYVGHAAAMLQFATQSECTAAAEAVAGKGGWLVTRTECIEVVVRK